MDAAELQRMAEQLANLLQLNRRQPQSGGGGSGSGATSTVPPAVKSFHKAAANGDLRRCVSYMEKGGDPCVRGKGGLTALHLAAHSDERRVAKELLERGADLEAADEDGDTPLMVAVMNRQKEMTRLLMDAGASLRHRNRRGHTPADAALLKQSVTLVRLLEDKERRLQLNCELHERSLGRAAQEGNCDVVEYWLRRHPRRDAVDHRYGDDRTLAFTAALNGQYELLLLLDRLGADFEIADKRRHTPLFCGAQNGHLRVVEFLVGKKRCSVAHCSVTGRTALFSACGNGHADVARLLLESGADVNHKDEDGTTPLELAIRCDHVVVFRLLVESGADLLVEDNAGYDMAMTAAMKERLSMLQELHRHGVPLNRVNRKNGETALLAASQVGSEEAVRFLLDNGADKNHRNQRGVSPALRAAFNGLAGVLRVLGDAGAQLDLANRVGETAAVCAAQSGSLEMVQYLHGKGCRMDVADDSGRTLAWHAAKKDCAELLRFLREVDAPLDVADKSGDTPLMLAVRKKASAEVVRLLLQFGCSAERQNRQGESPIDVARRQGRREILEALGVEETRRRRRGRSDSPELPERQEPPAAASPGNRIRLDASFEDWKIIHDRDGKRPIGEGGFGKVYKAYTDKHQFVAVKVVKSKGADPRAVARVLEAEKKGMEMLKSVQHPNIVVFLKCQEKEGKFCIFTELIAGIDLRDLMQKQGQGFNEAGVQKFSVQICSALNHLHTRKPAILHRDIKCSNIMITHEGVIKLIDFGLAKEVVTTTSIVYTSAHACGTLCFMAPELLDGDDDHVAYSPRTDVWAFGCTVFELATMLPPNADVKSQGRLIQLICNRPLPSLPDEFSREAHDFYRCCVRQQPGDRADTDELMDHPFLAQLLR